MLKQIDIDFGAVGAKVCGYEAAIVCEFFEIAVDRSLKTIGDLADGQ
jgi:hypothetical protein